MKHNKVFIAFATTLLLTMSCKDISEKTELKLAHGLAIDHPVHIAM